MKSGIRFFNWQDICERITTGGWEVILHDFENQICENPEFRERLGITEESEVDILSSVYVVFSFGEDKLEMDIFLERIKDWPGYYTIWKDREMVSHK